jgi:DNA repair protein SbcC/Rad50
LDEGFEMLRSDNLELILNQLQSSEKMVGMISHVEAIPLQIRVIPKGDTSLVSLN